MKNLIPVIVALLALLTVILISSCSKRPLNTSGSNNSEIDVEFLFEKDGIKVYRFYDGYRKIYYTDARGKTEWRTSNGKTSQYHSVETAE